MSRCRTRTSGCCSSNLPDELIFKILSWTCVISLFRCKSVCKSWLSMISKPEFMKTHLTNSLSKLPSILMITSKIDDEEYVHEQEHGYMKQPLYGRRAATIVSPQQDSDSLNLPLLSPFDGNVEFVSSCNGIVCVCVCDLNGIADIYLYNPLTRRIFKKLPPPIHYSGRYPFCVDVVFGFDCLSHDFKVVKIDYDSNDTNNYKLVDVVAVHLYSSNAGSWRVVEVNIQLPTLVSYPLRSVLRSGPVVDGVLYLEGMDVIVTFDLHNESFGLISYPSFMHTKKSNVFDFQGSVAVVVESGSLDKKEVSLWTMEAVSDEVFWNKLFTFDAGLETLDWVFLYCGAEKFVAKTKLGTVLYDYRKKKTKYVGLPSPSFLVRVLKHTERFLSVE